MSEKMPEQNPVASGEEKQERHIPLGSFVEGEKVNVPLHDAELAALKESTLVSLRKGVEETSTALFAAENSLRSKPETERVLQVHIHNLAQLVGWDEAKRFAKEAKERARAKDEGSEKGGASSVMSKTNQILRSFLSSF